MGEIEGTYRALQTPAARLSTQTMPMGTSTLESGQGLGAVTAASSSREKLLPVRVRLLDDSMETFATEVSTEGGACSCSFWKFPSRFLSLSLRFLLFGLAPD